MSLGQALYVTAIGRLTLESEVACLRALCREVAAEMEQASRQVGASAGTLAAEAEAIERETRRLMLSLRLAVQLPAEERRVAVGSRVRLRGPRGRHHTLTLVGPVSANPTVGLVSFDSALGRALLGREVDDVVDLREVGFDWNARILDVETEIGGRC